MPQRNYLGAIEILNQYQTAKPGHPSRRPGYEKLEAMRRYLNRCGIPPKKLDSLPVIHVTGTHGKGSSCFYCERIMINHGYKVGFYCSPHLLEVRERIRVDGKPISKSDFSDNFWEVYDMLDRQKENDDDMPLYFPLLTILAFHIFLESEIDVAIVEVGIGGEYDCTNVIRMPVAVGITPISIDHTAQLGATEESISWHKGGIMKPGSIAFTVAQGANVLDVLFDRSKERNCPMTVLTESLYHAEDGSRVPVHVKESVATLAIALSKTYIDKVFQSGTQRTGATNFSLDVAVRAIENSCWPGRYDVKKIGNIRLFLDGAHTQSSIRTTAGWFSAATKNSSSPKVLIFNLTGNREPELFLTELLICGFDVAIFMPNVGREIETADTANYKLTTETQLNLCEEYREKWIGLQRQPGVSKVFLSFVKALRFLGDSNNYDVLVTGSLYLVGAALSVLDPTLNGALVDE